MNKKVSLNFHDFASTLTHNKENIISPPGLYPAVSNNYAKIHESEPSYLTLIAIFMAAQFIALVTLNIVGLQMLKKTSTIQTAPSIHVAK
jgi:hypothetical protein